MNKLELINTLKNEGQISKKEAATIVDLFFSKISTSLAEGDWVEIRGLCSLSYDPLNTKKGATRWLQRRNPKN